MPKPEPTMSGMQPGDPHIGRQNSPRGFGRRRDITDYTPCPNWALIRRGDLSDGDYAQRWLMCEPFIGQMLASPRRRLIPYQHWEELVSFSIQMAITRWKGNGEGRCPLKNYAWVILGRLAIQWWSKNKHTILNQVEIDSQDHWGESGGHFLDRFVHPDSEDGLDRIAVSVDE